MKKEKVEMKLVGEGGNAFAIMGRFKKAALRAGWRPDEIEAVLKEARSDDYDHLLATIAEHVEEPFEEEEEEEEDFEEAYFGKESRLPKTEKVK